MNKIAILKQALQARTDEVLGYQINIDNYTRALEKINTLSTLEQEELTEFKQQLTQLLATETLEQKKAKIMLAVIAEQIGE